MQIALDEDIEGYLFLYRYCFVMSKSYLLDICGLWFCFCHSN